ncbi:MAG: hypothetical protein AAGC84_07370, partial [Pseudomonas sp.]
MEKSLCHYHPAQPATWLCHSCPRHYGDCCVPLNDDAPEQAPSCPLCTNRLEFLGAANTAEPFWERIPQFFTYGLQQGPLAFSALLALASLFMPASLILWTLLFSIATKYFYSVIEANSEALREAPSLASAFTGSGFSLFFKQLAVFILCGIAMWLAADSEIEALFWLVSIGVVLLMPASIIFLHGASGSGKS